jgi:hypothetical protein
MYVGYLSRTKESKTTIVRVKGYSAQEFEQFVKARDVISSQVLQYIDLYKMVAIMHNNLAKTHKKLVKRVEQQQGIDAREDLAELNAYFAALVANFGMYLGCVPNLISSKQQVILDVHRRATRKEYDNSFAYRLLYALRNYTLHHEPPVTGIRGSSRKSTVSGNADVEYEVFIKKSQLLRNSVVAKKLATDFALPTENYPVIETTVEAMRSLKTIHWKTVKALFGPIEKEVSLIESLASLTSKHDKQPYVVEFKRNEDGNGMDAQLHLIPTQILDYKAEALKY